MRATPAGTEMRLRTTGTMRPKNTEALPWRANQPWAVSKSSPVIRGRRSNSARARSAPSQNPSE